MSAPTDVATPTTPATGVAGRRSRFARGALAAAAIAYVALLLLLPLIGIVAKAFEPGISIIGDTLSRPEVQHAFLLTGIITVITVAVTTFFGLVVAWVLVRQRFLGRAFMNAVVDLPFALSPVTVGLAAVPATDPAGGRSRFARGALAAAAIAYLALLLLLPLIGIVTKAFEPGVSIIGDTLSSPDVQHAFLLTGIITVITVAVTTFFGLVVAWVLVRQRFLGRSLMNAVVDLPFALSPVTVGLAAVLLFGTGGWFTDFVAARGIQVLFALPSMVLVTIFICIPFTIREVVPVLEEFGLDEEDASRTLGASIWQTFRRVTLPNIRWALLYGVALSTARSIGEIGAVLIVSGTISGKTETATIYIFSALEERLEAQAHVVALVLAGVSIVLLIGIEWLHRRNELARSNT